MANVEVENYGEVKQQPSCFVQTVIDGCSVAKSYLSSWMLELKRSASGPRQHERQQANSQKVSRQGATLLT